MTAGIAEQTAERLAALAPATGTTASMAQNETAELIAADSGGARIRVHGLVISASAATTLALMSFDGESGYTELFRLAVGTTAIVIPPGAAPYAQTIAGEALLVKNLGASAATVTYALQYALG